MTVEYIRYTVESDARGGELVEAYTDAAKSLDVSPACLGYELARCEEDPLSYIFRIEWQSTEAHLEGFRKSKEFQAFFAAIGGFLKQITEMRHYVLTSVVREKP
ncbi:MAG TPA: antibiotic biosynthesis monooxygenase family protein [Acidisarcina sp.]